MKFFYVMTILLAGFLAGCGSKSLKDKQELLPPQLLFMKELWSGVRGDQDAKDLAGQGLAVQLAQAGYPVQALGILEAMNTHHGLVGMAKLSCYFAQKGDLSVARIYLQKAEQESARFFLTMPRELAIEMAHAYAATDQMAMAEKWKEKLFDPADVAVAQSLIEAEQIRRGKLSLDEVSVRTEPELLEVIALSIRPEAGSSEKLANWLNKAEERADLMYVVDRVQAYISLAKAADRLGLKVDSERLLDKAQKTSLQISPRIESGTLGRVLVARALMESDKTPEASEWILKAKENIPENPYMAQPKCYAEIAALFWRMGNQAEAEVLWTEGLQRARTHLHPRARRLGSMAVVASLWESKVMLTSEQEAMVQSVIQEEVQPPPLATNQLEDYLQEAGVPVSNQEGKAKKKPTKAEGTKKSNAPSGGTLKSKKKS